jgi:hypothetical protein
MCVLLMLQTDISKLIELLNERGDLLKKGPQTYRVTGVHKAGAA